MQSPFSNFFEIDFDIRLRKITDQPIKYVCELKYDGVSTSLKYKDGVLTVSGQVNDSEKEYVEKGLAFRKFMKQFQLHKDVVVNDAKMEDGVLTVKLGVNEPETIEAQDINIK